MPTKLDGLKETCREVRKSVLQMAHAAGMAHVGSCFSMVDILAVLYSTVLNVDPNKPEDPDRDIFILSKGHAALALYNILAAAGFFPKEKLAEYCKYEAGIGGHPERRNLPGVEATTGALGHGLPIGIGIALASRHDKLNNKVVVLMGDGEQDEGTVWEAAMAAAHYKLDNLIAITDRNMLQADSPTEQAMALGRLDAKWESFGWNVETVDGHDLEMLGDALGKAYRDPKKGMPHMIIARTIKGKGVSFMENEQAWHFNIPTAQDVANGLNELNQQN